MNQPEPEFDELYLRARERRLVNAALQRTGERGFAWGFVVGVVIGAASAAALVVSHCI